MRARLREHVAGGRGAERPRRVGDDDALAQQVVARAERDGAGRRRDVGHVAAFADRDRETAPLADRERVDAVVPADLAAVGRDERAGPARDARAEERLAAALGDEAHVHALRLGRGAQPERGRTPADLRLRELADGKQRVRQLLRAEHVEDVRLVLRGVGTAPDRGTVRRVDDTRVVTGGNGVETELARPLERAAELHRAVALDARVRGTTLFIGRRVRRDDVLREPVGEVEDVVRDVELRRDPARVLDVRHAAATGVALTAPELERHAGDVMARVAQQRRGHRRVHPAAHHRHHLHDVTLTSCPTAAGITARAVSMSAAVDA